jgi:hypothetical protein
MAKKISWALLWRCVFQVMPQSAHNARKSFIFGLLLVGPYNDRGWSQAHYEAGRRLVEIHAEYDVLISGIDTTEAVSVAAQKAKEGKFVRAIPYDYINACDGASAVCLGVGKVNLIQVR